MVAVGNLHGMGRRELRWAAEGSWGGYDVGGAAWCCGHGGQRAVSYTEGKQVGQPGHCNTHEAGKGLRCQGGRREARRREGSQRAAMHVGQPTTGLLECDQGVGDAGGAVWCCSHGSRGAASYREETRRGGHEDGRRPRGCGL